MSKVCLIISISWNNIFVLLFYILKNCWVVFFLSGLTKKMSLSQKKEKSFFHEYEQIALLQSTYPLPYIMSRKGENFLVINVDQILQNEWPPILTALRKDTTLKYISLSSSWQRGKGFEIKFIFFKHLNFFIHLATLWFRLIYRFFMFTKTF